MKHKKPPGGGDDLIKFDCKKRFYLSRISVYVFHPKTAFQLSVKVRQRKKKKRVDKIILGFVCKVNDL